MKLTTEEVKFIEMQLAYQKDCVSSIIQECKDQLKNNEHEEDNQTEEIIIVCSEEVYRLELIITKFNKALEHMH